MDDFDFFVALLTPASDLVGGDPGSETQGIFARAGNDTIYGYDPGINNNENPKVDVLVGDLFDNSPEEFQIIVDIQEGNPLAILDRGKPPSVGADRFVLGDEIQPYYTTFDPISLVGDNLLGINQFAVLYDFDPEQDIIQLNGKKNDYELLEVNGLVVEGIDQPFFGEAIFSLQQGAPDLVGYVISTPEVDLDLDKNYFEFVGDKPEDKPDEKKIGQLGTTGIDQALGVATDGDGNVYIAGSTSGPLGGANQGSSDAWVARYNSNGNQTLLQQSNISTPSGDIANAVATDDNGNYYLAGSRGSNAWVAKYNNSGQEQWSNLVSLPGAFTTSGFGLDIDGEGNVYLSGLGIKENPDRATFDFAVEDDAWIAKFDTGGTRQWLTPIDTPFFNENYDLAVDEAGNSYAVGWTQGLVEESDPSRDLLKYDVWISKQDTNGNIEWIQQLGSADEGLEFAWGVDTDSQGNIYVTGWTTGALGTQDKEFEKSESYDVFLAKFAPELDQDGNSLLWAKQIGSQGDDGMFLADLHVDAQDNIFLTGYTNDKLGKGDEDKDASSAWVGRFDTEGNNQWIQQFGSKDALDYGTDLSTDGNGNLYVTGSTEGFLGTSNGAANGAAVDAWLAQLDVEKGKLQEFIGEPANLSSILDPEPIATTDITNQLVVNEQLPDGDNQIDPDAGLENTSGTVDYGQVVSNITDPFNPRAENSFGSALVEFLGEDLSPETPSAETPTEVEDLKLDGTDEADNLAGDVGDDDIKGEKGDDTLFGDAGDDKLEGKDGNDTLIGGTGSDDLKGGNNIDELIGVDTINGVSGLGVGEIDLLKGEGGSDRFVLGDSGQVFYDDGDATTGGVADYALIDDFKLDQGDTIQLEGSSDNYVLETSPDGLPNGTGIFLTDGQTEPEAIAVVKNVDLDELSLDDSEVFLFSEETPVEETPEDETPVDETPVEETPEDETPEDETPVEETPVEETPEDETPSDETPTDETPVEETPEDETSGAELATEETTPEVEDLKLDGTDEADNLAGDVGDDDIKGEKGDDTLFGDAGDDKLEGKDGNDTLIGGTGSDELKGGNNIDELIGVDTINGVSGLGVGEIDLLKGEGGSDRFVLGDSGQVFYDDGDTASSGVADYALIDDFKLDQGDTIQLAGTSDNYVLETSPDGLPNGTGIFLTDGQTEPEAIAVVKDVDLDELSLDDSEVFSFI